MGDKEIARMKKYLRAQAILTGGEADLEKMTLKLTCRIPYLEKETNTGEGETEIPKGQERSALLTVFLKPDGKVMKYVLSLPDAEEEQTYTSDEELLEEIQQEQLSVAKTFGFISRK